MTTFLYALLKSLLLPPGLFVLVLFMAFLFRRLSWGLIALAALYLLSTPYVSSHLMAQLEAYPALTEEQIMRSDAQAIVVLGGGRYSAAPEYGGDTLGEPSLVRARYGAYLHHKTGLRLIASSGKVFEEEEGTEADLIKAALETEFKTAPVLVEDQSRNTLENARFTAHLLEKEGILKAYVVTHAWHMHRAVIEFERAGIEVVPAPTQFATGGEMRPAYLQWLPNANSLNDSRAYLHEAIGRAWYGVKGLLASYETEPTPAAP